MAIGAVGVWFPWVAPLVGLLPVILSLSPRWDP